VVARSEFEPSVPPSMPLRWPITSAIGIRAGCFLWVLAIVLVVKLVTGGGFGHPVYVHLTLRLDADLESLQN